MTQVRGRGGPRRQSAGLLVVALVAVALVAACTGTKSPPKVTVPPTPETTVPVVTLADHSGDSLGGVPGRTTLTVGLTPGTATLNGVVTGPDGLAVPGAAVRLERLVGDQVAAATVGTGADGTWTARGIIGGLYRVRSWRPPDLAQTTPAITFLGAKDTQALTLHVDRFTGVQVTSSLAPNPPIIGSPANLVVAVDTATVGPDGIVRGQGRPGVGVQLFGEGQWVINGSATRTTNSGGFASWQLTCQALGNQPLSVLVNGTDTFPLDLSACAPVPPPPTTAPPTTGGPTTSARGQTTTTGRTLRPTTTAGP